MTATALSEEQSQALSTVVSKLAKDCDARAVVISDIGGYIMAKEADIDDKSVETAAALAAGSFAATRELADIVGEEGFKSICHRGVTSGVLIQALGKSYLILVLLGKKSIEGLVRLHLKKVTKQLESIVNATAGQSVHAAGATGSFEVRENDAATTQSSS